MQNGDENVSGIPSGAVFDRDMVSDFRNGKEYNGKVLRMRKFEGDVPSFSRRRTKAMVLNIGGHVRVVSGGRSLLELY